MFSGLNPAKTQRSASKTRTPLALTLRKTRLALGYTIEGWRKLLGVGWRTVEGWELDGVLPRPATLAALYHFLALPANRARLEERQHAALRAELRHAGLWR